MSKNLTFAELSSRLAQRRVKKAKPVEKPKAVKKPAVKKTDEE